MKIIILILFFGLSISAYSQDFSEDNSYIPPEETQVDDYAIEQQQMENEERAREAQMIQEQQAPVDVYDNSGDFGY